MKHFQKQKNENRGIATLEMLIAFAIIILTITSVIPLVFGSQSASIGSQTDQEALYKAKQQIENARATAKSNFFDPSLNPGTTVSSDTNGIVYIKNLLVTHIDDFTKQITSTITWGGGRQLQLSTRITDWQSALGGDTCNPILSGDWAHPKLLGYVDFSSSEGASDVKVFGKKVFITSDPTSAGQEDFYIYNVNDPTLHPLPDFGPTSKINTGPGLVALQVAGKYAFVANKSRTAQLQIIDISNPSAPFVAKSFKLTNVTGTGSQAIGNSIYYANKKIYLGLTKTATGPEFNIIDIADFLSNPANNPVLIGSWSAGTSVNDISVKNDIAYLTTPWPSSNPPTKENLSVLDVSNPVAGITRINTWTYPNVATMSGISLYVSKDGNTLYFGRGGLNSAHNPEFFSLNITNPNNIIPLNSKYIGSTVNAVTVRSNLAFMITGDTNLGFQIWDLNNLSSLTPYASLNIQQTATGGMDCDGNLLYIAQRSNRALQIVGSGAIDATVSLAVHNTTHNPITTANVGDVVHGSVSVVGSGPVPTGEIDLTFYTSGDCSSGGTADIPFILDGTGMVDPSSNQGPLVAGSYSFRAHYDGDLNYNPGDSVCKSLSVAKITPSVNTTIYNNSTGNQVSSVLSGTTVYDMVTITGGVGIPTGSVNFVRYNKNDCTGSNSAENNITLVSGVAKSLNFTTGVKSISYKVHYNGDAKYNAVDGACEPLNVN